MCAETICEVGVIELVVAVVVMAAIFDDIGLEVSDTGFLKSLREVLCANKRLFF